MFAAVLQKEFSCFSWQLRFLDKIAKIENYKLTRATRAATLVENSNAKANKFGTYQLNHCTQLTIFRKCYTIYRFQVYLSSRRMPSHIRDFHAVNLVDGRSMKIGRKTFSEVITGAVDFMEFCKRKFS